MRHAPIGESSATREIGDVLYMVRSHDARVVHRDIHKNFVELDVLLRMSVYEIVILQSRERENRGAIELRIVEAIQQMQAAGT